LLRSTTLSAAQRGNGKEKNDIRKIYVMLTDKLFALAFADELEAEAPSTRKCLERFRMELTDYKPHERSMAMGYLALLVAEIPMWINVILKDGEIDFATFSHYQPKSTDDLLAHFEKNVADAKATLRQVQDGDLGKPFYFKQGGQLLMETTIRESLQSTINHLVHHRGQLTVYMRMNNIDVPAIYGPSADDRSFGQLQK
jgi:uncharacterized damage-inducible protein DinB